MTQVLDRRVTAALRFFLRLVLIGMPHFNICAFCTSSSAQRNRFSIVPSAGAAADADATCTGAAAGSSPPAASIPAGAAAAASSADRRGLHYARTAPRGMPPEL